MEANETSMKWIPRWLWCHIDYRCLYPRHCPSRFIKTIGRLWSRSWLQTGNKHGRLFNLGKAKGTYYETTNYAVAESEPGSTFKLADLMAILEDVADTSTVLTKWRWDSLFRRLGIPIKGYGKISLARGFELSSNTVMVKAVYDNYKNNLKSRQSY
jgi:cell division protein FtsI/penicillin-binding protein 2